MHSGYKKVVHLKLSHYQGFKVFLHPFPSQAFPTMAPFPQAWTCPVLLWVGWSLFGSFQLGALLPLLCPFFFLWTSSSRVLVVTAVPPIAHPYTGNAGSQMPVFPSDWVCMWEEYFPLYLAEGKSEVGLVFLTCTSVEMEKFFTKYKGWDLVDSLGYILINLFVN